MKPCRPPTEPIRTDAIAMPVAPITMVAFITVAIEKPGRPCAIRGLV